VQHLNAMREDLLFEDRRDAGQALAHALAQRKLRCSAVLGLVRGGVPVAAEVAKTLNVPLDILAVKKLRAPFNEELAIGAICADGAKVIHQDIIEELGISPQYLEREVQARMAEAGEAEELYRGKYPPLEIAVKSVLIVDDGIATGATMEAGVLSVRQRGADFITVATPVGSRDACNTLRQSADEVICLTRPLDFWAVGRFYLSFPPVPNEEVRRLLDQNRRARVKTNKGS
jgi:putative phosphoribosyl transferase